MFPILIYLSVVGVNILESNFNQTKLEKVHAYEYIGRCYVDKNCRHLVVGNPVQTDDDVINVTKQIRQDIISKIKSANKKH